MAQKRNSIGYSGQGILNLFVMATFIHSLLPTLHYRLQPAYKILRQYLNPRLDYFLKFKMVAVRHLGIVTSS